MIFSLTELMLTLPLIGPLVLVLPAVGQQYLQGQQAVANQLQYGRRDDRGGWWGGSSANIARRDKLNRN
jgi:Tfp pilus assembly protein PilW